jgi:hypothetical protein
VPPLAQETRKHAAQDEFARFLIVNESADQAHPGEHLQVSKGTPSDTCILAKLLVLFATRIS